ncbi:MAG: RsmB/NOP family class I SAM-dependent RNA methyltransferase [Kiloniellales bacterium]
MTPAARIASVIELLGLIEENGAPADRTVADYLRQRRFIGSKDRHALVSRTFGLLRRKASLDWWLARTAPGLSAGPRARVLVDLVLEEGWSADRASGSFDGQRHHPSPLSGEERRLLRALQGQHVRDQAQPEWVRLEVPPWLLPRLKAALGVNYRVELAALMGEAPLDLRANTLKATRGQVLAALAEAGTEATLTPLSPLGLRVAERKAVADTKAFRDGWFEIQDEGSQVAAAMVDARPGMRVVDFCAGAGGKTLAMAASMGNKGQIVACDVLEGRLTHSVTRLHRAGVHNVTRRPLSSERDPWVKRHKASFDRVLVDAPCSGSGTWRRSPDAKWRMGEGDIAELIALQPAILDSASRLVKPGGRLVYVTCSLLAEENEGQIEEFLAGSADFALVPAETVWPAVIGSAYPGSGPMLRLSPAAHGTDGFFIAVLERVPTS